MESARTRDPDNWEYAYGLAVAQALNGQDPRPAAALALQLNPRDVRTRELVAGATARRARAQSPGRRACADSIPVTVSRVRLDLRIIRPPLRRARPRSKTGIAAKPVNGS